MNKFMKVYFSVILAVMIVISCCVSYGAAFSNETNDIIVMDSTVTLNNNEVFFNSFNVTENYPGSIKLADVNGAEKIDFAGKDCVDGPKTIASTPNVEYDFYTCLPNGYGGGHTFKFDKTGGVYRKVRVKLSRYSYFNEDGSHTQDGFNYHFGETEYVGKDSYSSCLVIVSGAAINFVTPDKRGYVEFYTSTNIGVGAGYYTEFGYKLRENGQYASGGGGGVNGGSIDEFAKGSINSFFISIVDVTELQLYIAKSVEFDKMTQYRADVDCNNDVSIIDATKIQLYLAGIE